MTTNRTPPRAYRVTLKFDSIGPAFACIEQAHSIPMAITQAERYARSCGWNGEVIKRFVNEVDVTTSQEAQA